MPHAITSARHNSIALVAERMFQAIGWMVGLGRTEEVEKDILYDRRALL